MKNSNKKQLSQLSNCAINQQQQLNLKGGTDEAPPIEETPAIIIEDMIDV